MKTIFEPINTTQTINKSEFITHLYKVSSIDEVNELLAKTKKTYYDATHNVYAYIIGFNQEIKKASDDGEPSQTAGIPILNVLEKNNLTNILCIVTRYFGGIKLGAGGLVRAYSSSASLALTEAKFLELTKIYRIEIKTNYQSVNTILKHMETYKLYNKLFLDEIYLYYEIKIEDFDSISLNLKDISKNQAEIKILEELTLFL